MSPTVEELGFYGKKVVAQCDHRDNLSGQIHLGGWTLTQHYVKHMDKIRNMSVRPSDIWVLSYPRSGTTWTQEMCWGLAHDCQFEGAKSEFIYRRYTFLEFVALGSAHDKNDLDGVERLDSIPHTSRRFIKSHLPIEFLPKDLFVVKPKILYVCRDPRDALVSFHHHYRGMYGYTGSFEDFFEAFYDGDILWGPYWKHVLQFWEMQKQEDCLMFIAYEDMKKDLLAVVKRTADFLHVSIPEGKEEDILQHLSFEAMERNPMVNMRHRSRNAEDVFIRKGQIGGWKTVLTPEQNARMIQLSRSWLKESDYPFFNSMDIGTD